MARRGHEWLAVDNPAGAVLLCDRGPAVRDPVASLVRRHRDLRSMPSPDAPPPSRRAEGACRFPLCRAFLCIRRASLFPPKPMETTAMAAACDRGHRGRCRMGGENAAAFPPLRRLSAALPC